MAVHGHTLVNAGACLQYISQTQKFCVQEICCTHMHVCIRPYTFLFGINDISVCVAPADFLSRNQIEEKYKSI